MTVELAKETGGRPRRLPVPPNPRAARFWIVGGVVVAVLVAAHVLAWVKTGSSVKELVTGVKGMWDFVEDAVPPATDWHRVVQPGLKACGETLAIGLLGTTLSIPTSLVLALLGARTVTGNPVCQIARAVMSFLRAVPDLIWALIFITAVGLGPFPGVLALIVHNSGVMGKLWSEAMEEIDQGPVEALRSAGASSAQTAAHVVLPSVVPQFVGLLLYRFDVNVRTSLVLGLVGAGGVGFLINQAISYFAFDEVLTYILMVLVMIVVVDVVSGVVRRRLSDA